MKGKFSMHCFESRVFKAYHPIRCFVLLGMSYTDDPPALFLDDGLYLRRGGGSDGAPYNRTINRAFLSLHFSREEANND